jgi:hypothetical protein
MTNGGGNVAIKPKPKSFELDILSEAEVAMSRIEDAKKPIEEVIQEIIDDNAPERGKVILPTAQGTSWLSVMNPMWHAGVDIEELPAMSDEECVLFDSLRQRGTYVVVIKKGRKYYLEDASGGVDPTSKSLKTKLVEELIKKGWLAKSVRDDYVGYFVTSHMVFGWRKRIGV